MQLHGRYALERCRVQVDGIQLLEQGERGACHCGAGLHAEILAAVLAAIRHFGVGTLVRILAATLRAKPLSGRPNDGFKPGAGGVLIGESLRQFE